MTIRQLDDRELFNQNSAVLDRLSWDRESALAERDWSLAVPESVVHEFEQYLASADGRNATPDEVELRHGLSAMPAFALDVRQVLMESKGFAHIRELGQSGFDEHQLRLFYVLLGLALGDLLETYGRLHDVFDRGVDFRSTEVSVSKTRVKAPFHTDSTSRRLFPNVIGLLCLRPAMSGGQSMLVNACHVYREIERSHSKHLPALFSDHYRNTVTPGDEDVDVADNAYPVFTWGRFSTGPTFRYMRHWIETGYAKAGEQLDEDTVAAFDCLDDELERDRNVLGIDLAAGDILLVNNALVAHTRTPFEDYTDPDRKRLLARAWLRVPEHA